MGGIALGSNFSVIILRIIVLENSSFRGQFHKQLWEKLWEAILRYKIEKPQLWGNSFGPLWGAAVAILGRSFRELLCRMALGGGFGEQICGIAAWGQ